MGLLDRIVSPVKNLFSKPSDNPDGVYRTFTEYAPQFSAWDGNLYEQEKTRAIVERIASACSKLKPEFVTPDGSAGSIPRMQRLVQSRPNDMMSWPTFLKRVATLYYVHTTAFIVPGYDKDGSIVSLWPMNPSYTELVDYKGEPWLRFHLKTGEVQAFPFYDVVILTRFQLESDIFGGGNKPLTPTLRLMDAQRQAEEIALKTGADIRFIGKVTTNMHEDDLKKYRNRFSEDNFVNNKSRLILHDNRIDDLKQVEPQHFVSDKDAQDRIDKALYAYFGINEAILTNSYTEQEWAAFYEGTVESFGLSLGQGLTTRYLTAVQIRKGNHFMFSASYLEYATPESKLKVVSAMVDRGIYTLNEARDVFQLPHIPGGDVRMFRGEYYLVDKDNKIIAESGGRTKHETSYPDDDSGELDEPDSEDTQTEQERALRRLVAQTVADRIKELEL